MQLTLEQAIAIRNDHRNLEGQVVDSGGMEKVISKVVVAPYYSEKLNKFIEEYHKQDFEYRDDEEKLAKSLNPEAYCAYAFYEDIGSIYLYDNIFNALNELSIKVDYKKYGIAKTD